MTRKDFALAAALVTGACTGCSSVPLKEGGTLSAYDRLGPTSGWQTKSRSYVDASSLIAEKTVAIAPTRFSAEAAVKIGSEPDRRLLANAIDRSLCIGVSDGYRLIGNEESADLVIRAVVTDIVKTDRVIAGVSTATSLGSSLVLPVGLPRLPFGLGGLAVEAEAVDATGQQRAAVVWSRGANSFTTPARISEIGDAYSLASAFGSDFANVMVAKRTRPGFRLASAQRIRSSLGGKPKFEACEVYGRSPGLVGRASGRIGVPPEWIDDRGS